MTEPSSSSSRRDIPGFYYDATTNRYYRIPRHGISSPQQIEIKEKSKKETKWDTLNKNTSRTVHKKVFDKSQWSFISETTSNNTLPYKRSIPSLDMNFWVQTLINPIVISAPGPVYSRNGSPKTGMLIYKDCAYDISWSKDPKCPSYELTCPILDFSVAGQGDKLNIQVQAPYLSMYCGLFDPASHGYEYASYLLNIYDLDSPNDSKLKYSYTAPNKGHGVVCFSNDAKLIFIGDGSSLLVYRTIDPNNSNTRYVLNRINITALCHLDKDCSSPQNGMLLVGGTNGHLGLYNWDDCHKGKEKLICISQFKVPEGETISRLWYFVESKSIFALTFHGQLIMYDQRYPDIFTCIFKSSSCDAGTWDKILDVAFTLDGSKVFIAIKDMGVVVELNPHKSPVSQATWRFPPEANMKIHNIFIEHGTDLFQIVVDKHNV